jgi:RNA polymerase sigma-70 factor, ECF subfamily
MRDDVDFDRLVSLYYEPLYRFALSMTHHESDACDLTQETFHVWAAKGGQLQDPSKVKSWLFTTLHRRFLETQRRLTRFPHFDLDEVTEELPALDPAGIDALDAREVVALLRRVDARFQSAVALFYLEDCSYSEIGEILQIPQGTVKSRISRGLAQLKSLLQDRLAGTDRTKPHLP